MNKRNMLRIKQFFILPAFMVLLTINAFSQAGTLDDTFSDDGKALFDLGDSFDVANSVIALEDTTTILCGATWINSDPTGFVMRVLQNGEQDMTFGTNGYLELQFGIETYAQSLALLSDGKILVSGICYITFTEVDIFVARLSQDGTLDPTFGTSGYILYDYNDTQDLCYAMAVQSDGKVVLGGKTSDSGFSDLLFLRINSDGTVDTGFGTNGYTVINASLQDERVRGLDFMSNGDIIGAGYGYVADPLWYEQAVVSKLDNNGNPVTSFGVDGVLTPAIFSTSRSEAWDVKVVNDSIVLTGFVDPGGYLKDLFLTKLDEDGIADPDFATNGISILDLNESDLGIGLLIQDNSKIYVSGTSGVGGIGDSEFLLVRYLSDGTLDDTFDGDGYTLTDFRADWDEPYGITMQPDGKLVMAGVSGGFTTTGENKINMARYLNDYNPFGAAFTASPNPACAGSTVDFVDMSTGEINSWSWTFEGGTPSSSSDQNPSVVYSTPGNYNVELEITGSAGTTSTLLTDYMVILETPAQADMPDGEASVCSGSAYDYSTSEVDYAQDYEWEISPSSAGDITLNGIETTVDFTDGWSGDFTLTVRASNICGFGDWSDALEGTVNLTPAEFTLQGGGTACEGTDGVEITLDGSESAIVYELFLDDATTGITVEGTGLSVSFGFIDVEGYYTAQAANGDCIAYMIDQVFVEILSLPSQSATPEGPVAICLEPTSDYTSSGSEDADSYEWEIYPSDAGTISFDELSATVTWNSEFSGTALISLYGINDCGSGESSELEVSVGAANPIISGEEIVCDFSTEFYEVEDHEGSTYLWEVSGGEITEGQGTYMITISWNGEGNGTVTVEEETADGCNGSSEVFEVVIDDCTGIGENSKNELSLYPNPAKDFINISFKSNSTSSVVTVYDITGQVALEKQIQTNNGELQLNVSNLTNGMYLIKVKSGGKILTSKLFMKN